MATIEIGDRVVVEKGCASIGTYGISKGVSARVTAITESDVGVWITLDFLRGFTTGKRSFCIRHRNRLGDGSVRMHTGDPTKFICVRKVAG